MSIRPPLLSVRRLSIAYRAGGSLVAAVHDVELSIGRGETLAVVGESGSGKSTIALAILGLLPANARILAGDISVDGGSSVSMADVETLGLRGKIVGFVPQDPMVGLNPTMRIGGQIGEAVTKASGLRGRRADAETIALLEQVGIDEPALRARQYPHQLSGGMRQRVLIAIAVAGNPALIIADEPTSALDSTVQKSILDHLARLAGERGVALLVVTHDLGLAADRADRVLVMKDGRIVEQGPPRAILTAPVEAYTRALIAAAPALDGKGVFGARRASRPPGVELLRFEGVSKHFAAATPGAPTRASTALDDVSFTVHAGRTSAIVGESGSGKTTICRIALGLEKPSSGRVLFENRDIGRLSWPEFRPLRRRIQLVQQDPFGSLDPRFTIAESVVEPLISFGLEKGAGLRAAASRLIDLVQLPRETASRYPRELSGGQRQRVAIARALAPGPDLVFLDEPVSALDVLIQSQILALLDELQHALGVAYVLVSHDLSVVASIADQIVVMRKGRIVEQGPTAEIFRDPTHPYTRELLDAAPGRRSSALIAI
ncbi:ABC transporter ATP-binding protein [Methylosinus sp. RM1]|uniref:dipeptide ABC transporter ATP-binding protein n=1 Tax=Methylosinus sp. RM1 TaxID=2583817 RepID=UPI00140E5DB9|nr:ABC transporter ATP-binding protein [Methylosinus sp. RM1]